MIENLEALRTYCKTPEQTRTLEAVIIHQSNNKASKALGLARQTVDATIKKLRAHAEKGGFTTQRANPSVTLIINQHAKNEAELVKPFWDAESASDYLTFIRKAK